LLQQYCAKWNTSPAIKHTFFSSRAFPIWNHRANGGPWFHLFTLFSDIYSIQGNEYMSPAGQPDGASKRSKIARQTPVVPILQTEPGAVGPVAAKKRRGFDPHAFLATIGEGRKFVLFPRKQRIFAQGDIADAVFYVQTGRVKLTVVSKTGQEATIGILREGDFFGEAALAGQALRMASATAMTDCAVLRIEKEAMMEALHRKHEFSDLFVAYLLARNIRYEEDLVDQLFNSSEKESGSDPSTARPLWQRRGARDCSSQDQPGNARGNDQDNPLAGQLLHEPVQEIGVRRLLRRTGRRAASPQITAERCSARLSSARLKFRTSAKWKPCRSRRSLGVSPLPAAAKAGRIFSDLRYA
jgi:CRP-like cAMP-binding protein